MMITPAQKRAFELIDKFDGKVETRGEFDIYYCESVELQYKKECALIVVDEILSELDEDIDYGQNTSAFLSTIEFYKQVKKEIQNYTE